MDTIMWKRIPQFPTYEASNLGAIRNYFTKRVLKPQKHECYLRVTLRHDGKSVTRGIHQLVASAFFGHQPGMQVNHINGNKTDNSVNNLEWLTPKDNTDHAVRTGLTSSRSANQQKRVRIIETGQEFDSLTLCAKAIDGHPGNISRVLHGHTNSYKGYTFTFC